MNTTETASDLGPAEIPEAPLPRPAAAETPNLVCPSCGNTSLRASETRRAADIMPSLTGKTAIRCRSCHHRFYAKLPKDQAFNKGKKSDRKKGTESPWRKPETRRKIAQVGVFCLSLLAFACFLLFLTSVGNN